MRLPAGTVSLAGPCHILNGGIIATLIDCHAVCTAIAHAYRAESRAIGSVPTIWYATASLAVHYLRPAPIDRLVAVRARVVEARPRRTTLERSPADGVEVQAEVVAVRVPATWREEPQSTPSTARHNGVARALWPPTAPTIVAPSRRASSILSANRRRRDERERTDHWSIRSADGDTAGGDPRIATTADRLGYDAFFSLRAGHTTALCSSPSLRPAPGASSSVLASWGSGDALLPQWPWLPQPCMSSQGALHPGARGQHGAAHAGTPRHAVRCPLTRLRRVLTQVRTLLRGERIPLTVTTDARALRLGIPAVPELPMYVAGLAPASVRLTGELAMDGCPSLPAESTCRGRPTLAGRSSPTNPGRAVPICPVIPTAVGDTTAAARQQAAWFVAFYLTAMGEPHRHILARLGYKAAVEALMAANAPRTPPIVPDDAEVLLEELTILVPGQCARRLAGWYELVRRCPSCSSGPTLHPTRSTAPWRCFGATVAPEVLPHATPEL